MPVTLVDRLPLPNLKVYTTGSVLLLSVAVYYAVSVTNDPNWRTNTTLQRKEAAVVGSDGESVNSPPAVLAPVYAANDTRNLTEQVVEIMTFMMQEPLCMWERKNRSRNLIVFGMPGSTANSPEDRKSHDKDQISKTITSLATSEPEIPTVFRLGSGLKDFYGYIRRQLNSKVTIPNILRNESQELVDEPQKIAELFADQFVNSYVREPDGPIPSINMPTVRSSIDDVKFTAEIVRKTLLPFDDATATATGPDGIPSILLKRCSSLLAEHISNIMNKSMDDGCLLADWKKATVVPIYKKAET
ncbi:unnamed protein product [Parnassius apollo]|uniref:(apollo) hypothetical protein n=1 Tax=Parnassius apollo TaxID=110799 RepID=A0A8S3Y567_PARAO|nr:unnamed protein product [Parnassius apollo]